MPFDPFQITPAQRALLASKLAEYQDRPGLTGIDIGYKYTDGQPTGEIAIRFLMAKKQDLAIVPTDEVLPTEIRGTGDGTPPPITRHDVLTAPFTFERQRTSLQSDDERRKRLNPIRPGIGISHRHRGAGTLGAIVYVKDPNSPTVRPAILSCAHVLVPLSLSSEAEIFQPSLVDGGNPAGDAIATPFRLSLDFDAAVAVLNTSRMVVRGQLGTDAVLDVAVRADTLGETVTKSGHGTGITRARIDGIGFYFLRLFPNFGHWYEGFLLRPLEGLEGEGEISSAGDSGAVWYRAKSGGLTEGLGLHLDGEVADEEDEYAIAVHLPDALAALGASLSPTAVDTAPGRLAPGIRPDRPNPQPLEDLLPAKMPAWARQQWGSLGNGTVTLKTPPANTDSYAEARVVPATIRATEPVAALDVAAERSSRPAAKRRKAAAGAT